MLDNIIGGIAQLSGRLHGQAKNVIVTFVQIEGNWRCDAESTILIPPVAADKAGTKWKMSGDGLTPEIAAANLLAKLLRDVKHRQTEDANALSMANQGFCSMSEAARKAAGPVA